MYRFMEIDWRGKRDRDTVIGKREKRTVMIVDKIKSMKQERFLGDVEQQQRVCHPIARKEEKRLSVGVQKSEPR